MEIRLDGWAWLSKDDLGSEQAEWLRRGLTVADVRKRRPVLHRAYLETESDLGIPRSFFRESATRSHQEVDCTSSGDDWPSKVRANGDEPWAGHQDDDWESLTLVDSISGEKKADFFSPGEQEAVQEIMKFLATRRDALALFDSEQSSARVCASVIRSLKKKTLVVSPIGTSYKTWETVLHRFLPDAVVGRVRRDDVVVDGCHIVLTTPGDLSYAVKDGVLGRDSFGFIISHQIHRMDPLEWASTVCFFNAEKRLGITDLKSVPSKGLSRIYSYHLGRPAYADTGDRMIPKIRRVWSDWKLSSWMRTNPALISKTFVVEKMCSSPKYNQHVVEQILLALKAGRKIALFSEDVSHLRTLKLQVEAEWSGSPAVVDFIIDGMSPSDIESATGADLILTTFKFAKEFPEVPAIDTVVLATPVRRPIDAVNVCLLRDPDKKSPVIVDMRCDEVPACKDYGRSRDESYRRAFGDSEGGSG